MKMKNMLLFICVFFNTLSYAQKNTIELQITTKKGYGPFNWSIRGIETYSKEENNPLKKTYLQFTGIPTSWTDVTLGEIGTNSYQTEYQNYLLGNITRERYERLQKILNWVPDTLNLSKKPLKCKIAIAYGKDASGETKMVVDANNNLDLSDDVIFTPKEIDWTDDSNKDSLFIKNAMMVSYERLSGNKIIQEKAPFSIMHSKSADRYGCNFPQYATTQLDGEEIAICSDDFTSPSYNSTSMVLVDDSIRNGKKVTYDNIILMDEYIKIKGNVYKNKGVNWNKNVLLLEKTNLPQDQLYSTQVGFKAFIFEGQNFKTKSNISLDDYKGKYLFLDFWGVWCKPCVQELPNLKNIYDKIDKSKLEILGIVCESTSDAVEKMIDKYSITWPQILSDETNKIKINYRIIGYPTTLLINPKGIIVAKNLRGERLENKIKELMVQ